MPAEDWATVVALGWMGVSAVLTGVLRLRSDAAWVAFVERSPKVGAVVVFVRALGIDPVGALAALRLLFARGAEGPRPAPTVKDDDELPGGERITWPEADRKGEHE